MKRIPLSGKNGDGKFAIVDDEDFDIVSRISWYMNKYGYAVHTNHTPVKWEKRFWMHRFIMGTPDGMVTDHINHNKLDNRKSNLRICTTRENQWNSVQKAGISGFRGVSMIGKKWQARIHISKVSIYLGVYETKEEAAIAWNKASIMYRGKFAILNEI